LILLTVFGERWQDNAGWIGFGSFEMRKWEARKGHPQTGVKINIADRKDSGSVQIGGGGLPNPADRSGFSMTVDQNYRSIC